MHTINVPDYDVIAALCDRAQSVNFPWCCSSKAAEHGLNSLRHLRASSMDLTAAPAPSMCARMSVAAMSLTGSDGVVISMP